MIRKIQKKWFCRNAQKSLTLWGVPALSSLHPHRMGITPIEITPQKVSKNPLEKREE
jgi:hypothetical protein